MSFGGGGGSSSIATSADVALSNPADGQVLAYDGTLAKWKNSASSSNQLKGTAVYVEDYGAVGDGTTDDTVAIKAAIAACVAAAQSAGSYYAEVRFQAKKYLIAGALVQGGSTKANAQLPLPLIAPTAGKVTLAFVGVGDAATLPHWQQTVPQATGTVLATSLTGQAYDATYGLPSIIGGPTPEQGYGTTGAAYNNICFILDRITLQAPQQPSLCGIDLRGVAECNIRNGSAQADQTPSTQVRPVNFMTALLMPLSGNNDYCEIGQWSCEGWYCGVAISEHTRATSIRVIYCLVGIRVLGPFPHMAVVDYASVEACTKTLEYVDVSPVAYTAPGAYVKIYMLDVEGAYIVDATNNLYGEVTFGNQGDGITVDGGANFAVYDIFQPHGAATYPPAFPGSSVALQNPFWRDAFVTITGGTVTGVSVDGQPQGTAGLVMVPTGKSITLTYSVAPSAWSWTLL